MNYGLTLEAADKALRGLGFKAKAAAKRGQKEPLQVAPEVGPVCKGEPVFQKFGIDELVSQWAAMLPMNASVLEPGHSNWSDASEWLTLTNR